MAATTKKSKKEPKYVPEYKCKRCSKSKNMWIEQILLKLDKMKIEIERLQKSINFISEYLVIKDKVDKIE
jgi:hypothetical protein